MINQFIKATLLISLSVFGISEVSAHGFGGFHGGGMHGGGFAGGGGFHAAAGGMHMPAGGFRGAAPAGGLRDVAAGGGLRDLAADGGLRDVAAGGGLRGVAGMPGGLAAGGMRDLGAAGQRGPDGGGLRDLAAGGFRGALGGAGLGAAGAKGFRDTPSAGAMRASEAKLNSFLGMPSDAGMHHVAGVAGDSAPAGAGSRYVGPRGGTAARGAVAGQRGAAGGRAVTGPRGNTAARGFAATPSGIHTMSAASLHTGAVAVRRNFGGYGYYTSNWYARYPNAWRAAGWGAGYAWRAATWASLGAWFDYGSEQPVYYNYGDNVVYQGGDVFVDGQMQGTTDEYYQQAQDLVTAGEDSSAKNDGDWLPLGVFALTKEDHSSANMSFQLAVNKTGTIRGNYTNTVTGDMKPISGSVNKKKQRAAWNCGAGSDTIIETGLYNLTKDQAPALVHLSKNKTEQWILVRIQDDKSGSQSGQDSNDDSEQK